MKAPVLWVAALLVAAAGMDVLPSCGRHGPPQPAAVSTAAGAGRVAVTVDGEGYHPAQIEAHGGQALTLVFTRTTDHTCGQEVVFPDRNIRRELPLNRPVEIAVAAPASGSLSFTCGMGMLQGAIVVR